MHVRLVFHRLSDHKFERVPRAPSRPVRNRTLKSVTLLFVLFGAACTNYQPPPPQSPVRHALRERAAPESEPKDDPKIHRAPPPEYGNKVVVCGEEAIPKG